VSASTLPDGACVEESISSGSRAAGCSDARPDATLTRVDLGGHRPFFEQLAEQILGVVGSPGW
jgi:hypothetical protein